MAPEEFVAKQVFWIMPFMISWSDAQFVMEKTQSQLMAFGFLYSEELLCQLSIT